MIINNINELATAFDTTSSRIEGKMCAIARMDLHVDNSPTGVRISYFIGESNAELSCTFRYPFDSRSVTQFLNSFEPMVEDMHSIYDDPFDMLLNTTEPGRTLTIEDAGTILSEAEADGWKFSPSVDPQYILDLYNDMESDEGR